MAEQFPLAEKNRSRMSEGGNAERFISRSAAPSVNRVIQILWRCATTTGFWSVSLFAVAILLVPNPAVSFTFPSSSPPASIQEAEGVSVLRRD